VPADTLFSRPRRDRGRVERAAERVLARWRDDGFDVDELTSSILRGFAEDTDRAESDHAAGELSRYSVARVRAELLRAYRELGPTEATSDELAELFALPDADDASEPARDTEG
jgi:hypothetical protein